MKESERIVKIEPPDDGRLKMWVERLKAAYGDLLEVSSIGNSLLGRSICALHMGSGSRKVLYCGGVHGREWITTLLMMYFAEELLHAYRERQRMCEMDVGKLLHSGGLTIIPALNPDGIEIAINGGDCPGLRDYLSADLLKNCRSREFCRRWKSNARGVDINRNFNAGWDEMRSLAMNSGICGPSASGWTGEYPESEPETRAVVQLCDAVRFRHVLAFHSQGEEIYWNYRGFTPPRAHLMARVLSVSSGYALRQPQPDAAAAGLKDWFMEKYHAPAFTVEIGSGECPIPLSCFRFLYSRLREMLVLGAAI